MVGGGGAATNIPIDDTIREWGQRQLCSIVHQMSHPGDHDGRGGPFTHEGPSPSITDVHGRPEYRSRVPPPGGMSSSVDDTDVSTTPPGGHIVGVWMSGRCCWRVHL